jgi:hypothetical protein
MRKVGQTGILANKNTRFGLIDKVAAAIILVMGRNIRGSMFIFIFHLSFPTSTIIYHELFLSPVILQKPLQRQNLLTCELCALQTLQRSVCIDRLIRNTLLAQITPPGTGPLNTKGIAIVTKITAMALPSRLILYGANKRLAIVPRLLHEHLVRPPVTLPFSFNLPGYQKVHMGELLLPEFVCLRDPFAPSVCTDNFHRFRHDLHNLLQIIVEILGSLLPLGLGCFPLYGCPRTNIWRVLGITGSLVTSMGTRNNLIEALNMLP